MVQFTLPKNSKVRTGKTWPKPDGKNVRKFQIYRWSPDDGENPRVKNSRFWLEDGAFFRLQNVQLGYTLIQEGIYLYKHHTRLHPGR